MPDNRTERVATSVTQKRKDELEALSLSRSSVGSDVPVAEIVRQALDEYAIRNDQEIHEAYKEYVLNREDGSDDSPEDDPRVEKPLADGGEENRA